MDAKSGQLKNESKSQPFTAPCDAQETTNESTINVFEVVLDSTAKGAPNNTPGIAPKGALQYLYKDVQKGAPENVLKDTVATELQLLMQLPLHKGLQNSSIKGEIDETLYTALEGATKVSF